MTKKLDKNQIAERINSILKSHKNPYEKKIALYNCLKNIEVEDLQPIEKERMDYLLQSKLYGELAKQSLKKCKQLTVEDYSKKV